MSASFALIMAGGRGTRFWPASRAALPKQLLPITGADSMLRQTIDRLLEWLPADRIFVITADDQREAVLDHIGPLAASQVLAEPAARNTAPAIVLGLALMELHSGLGPEDTVVVLPADAHVGDADAWRAALERACNEAAAEQQICTIGIPPDHPATGYGYLELGDELRPGCRRLARFVEKPDRATAEGYLATGRYRWNAGIFAFPVGVMRAEVERQLPELGAIWGQVGQAVADGTLGPLYAASPRTSIDYGVMEGAAGLLTVEGDFGWNDVGAWPALRDVRPAEEAGVVRAARLLSIESTGNVVECAGRTVALLGVQDLVIVDTGDVLMVAPLDRAQEVKRLRALAAERGWTELV